MNERERGRIVGIMCGGKREVRNWGSVDGIAICHTIYSRVTTISLFVLGYNLAVCVSQSLSGYNIISGTIQCFS